MPTLVQDPNRTSDDKSESNPVRVAFYSHDTMGMGHLRRNLLIAGALAGEEKPVDALVISGAREAAFFAARAGLDCVTLPALRKDSVGKYLSRNLNWSFEQSIHFRSQVIASALDAFSPNVFIVDKVPRGVGNELDPSLALLQAKGQTKCVLGLRDILDEPEVVKREWNSLAMTETIDRFFDEVWIYGDQMIYDSVQEYQLPATVANRCHYTGYLNQAVRSQQSKHELDSQQSVEACSICDVKKRGHQLVVCLVGGGQDGFQLAAMTISAGMPPNHDCILITGPHMPPEHRQELHRLAMRNRSFHLIDHLVEADEYLAAADRVISMGGYNTVTSILSYCKPALVVPRIFPRREQMVRAKRLQELGLISIADPANLSAKTIRDWLDSDVIPAPLPQSVDLQGLAKIKSRIELLHQQRKQTA